MQMKERKRMLEKYKLGEEIESEDAEKIQRLCDIGLMKTGLNIENMRETAITTSLGIAILKEI